MHALEALCGIDGRYREKVDGLARYFSEMALFRYRIKMEVEYLLALSAHPGLPQIRKFTERERRLLRRLYQNLSLEDAEIIKAIETTGYQNIKKTRHDVKAVEIYMRLRLKQSSLADCLEWIHFGLTSEDVNNIAYALMLSDAVQNVMVPQLTQVHDKIKSAATENSRVAMLARTHGQPASPTTFGKEQNVYARRLKRQINQLLKSLILIKLNGASGNYNAHLAAFPAVNWLAFTERFVSGLNNGRKIRFEPNLVTTQIEPHDTYAELFDTFKRINNILIDFCQDMWRYISDEWVVQKAVEGEVGSSTMPHKVNPIDLENAEGNLGVANSLFEFFCRKLPISRLQRDLSDSTVERNFGLAFGFSLLAYRSIMTGLSKVSTNLILIGQVLDRHPEVITEGIQTILRREGVEAPYDKLKDLSRGKKLTLSDIAQLVQTLEISPEVAAELLALTPSNYTGMAQNLATL